MANNGVQINDATFRRGMSRLKQIFPKVMEESLKPVGQQVLTDAVHENPKTPLQDSFLRGSGTVWVNNINTFNSPWGVVTAETSAHRGQQPTRRRDFNKIAICNVAFTMDYAAYQHEGISKSGNPLIHKQPGTGPKYLERPFLHNRQKYLNILATSFAHKLQQLF